MNRPFWGLLTFLLLPTLIFSNTKYISAYYDVNSNKYEYSILFNERAVHCLYTSMEGLIFGGTGSTADLGQAILFYFDPNLNSEYNPSASIDGYPRKLVELNINSTTSDHRNIKGIHSVMTLEGEKIIFFATGGSGTVIPYAVFEMDIQQIYEYYPQYSKIAESPANMKFITATDTAFESGTYPLIYIACDSGSYGKIEIFDTRTMSFLSTETIDLQTTTGDYKVLSLTASDSFLYAGTLSIGNARILKIERSNDISVLFSPDDEYFRGDDQAVKGISAVKFFNDKIYAGTLSTSTKYGGNLFYYNIVNSTGVILGTATEDQSTWSVTELIVHSNEIYGATQSDYIDTGFPLITEGLGRIFKISDDGQIERRKLTDYRIRYGNPSYISCLTSSPNSLDVVFGTTLHKKNPGALLGLKDYYKPIPPNIIKVEKKENKFYVHFTPTGDDRNLGNASFYELRGGFMSIQNDPEFPNTKMVIAESDGQKNYFITDSLPYSYLYICAYDNVNNRSPYAEIPLLFDLVKVFPNPVRTGQTLNLFVPQSIEYVRIYNIAGELVSSDDLEIIEENTGDGMKHLRYDLTNDNSKRITSGVYLIVIKDTFGHYNIQKFAIIR